MFFELDLTNPAFYYISTGMMMSFLHGDVSLMLNLSSIQVEYAKPSKTSASLTRLHQKYAQATYKTAKVTSVITYTQ